METLDQIKEGNSVSARKLHEVLNIGREFSTWIKDRIQRYSLVEDKDFYKVYRGVNVEKEKIGRPKIEYYLTIDASELISSKEKYRESKEISRYVYIIQNTKSKNIKIGVATNPSERLLVLQIGSDVELKLIYTSGVCSNSRKIEAICHKHFKDYNVRGEWFKIKPSEAISFLESQNFVLTPNLLG